jgi:hypothetical protein
MEDLNPAPKLIPAARSIAEVLEAQARFPGQPLSALLREVVSDPGRGRDLPRGIGLRWHGAGRSRVYYMAGRTQVALLAAGPEEDKTLQAAAWVSARLAGAVAERGVDGLTSADFPAPAPRIVVAADLAYRLRHDPELRDTERLLAVWLSDARRSGKLPLTGTDKYGLGSLRISPHTTLVVQPFPAERLLIVLGAPPGARIDIHLAGRVASLRAALAEGRPA